MRREELGILRFRYVRESEFNAIPEQDRDLYTRYIVFKDDSDEIIFEYLSGQRIETAGFASREYVDSEITNAIMGDFDIDLSDYATKTYVDTEIANIDIGNIDLSDYVTNEEIKEVISGVSYNTTDHKITFSRYNDVDIVIDLPIEALLVGLSLDGDDLVLELEDGSTQRVPLNTLLVGVVKSVNGQTPNSNGEVNLSYSQITGLQDVINGIISGKQDKLTAGDNINIDPVTNVISASGGGTEYELTKDKIVTALSGSGINSMQLGSSISASGNYSTALGHVAKAEGYMSLALGQSSNALSSNSIAVGANTTSSNQYSTALGPEASALGQSSTSLGYLAKAEGNNSTALGRQSFALGHGSTALGRFSNAYGNDSIALGYDSYTAKTKSIAIGYSAVADGENSIAIGTDTVVSEDNVADFGSNRQVRVNLIPVNDRDAVSKSYLENVISSIEGGGSGGGPVDWEDIENKPNIPSNTSDLINDSDYTTTTYVDSAVANVNIDLSNYIQNEDIKEVISGVSYNNINHKITFNRYNDVDIVVDLPIENLLVGLSLNGDDLVLELEDGTTTSVPLNTLLVGVVKNVNGKVPNSSGVVSLDYSDLNNLPNLFSGDYEDLTNKPIIPDVSDFATTTYVDDKDTIKEQNNNTDIKFWTGTQAEYQSLNMRYTDTLYFIEEE